MSVLVLAAFAAATNVTAQPPEDPRIERALPSRAEIEGMGVALDRVLGAFLTVDVGPILDVGDPFRRQPNHGQPGRTLREMGERDDPYFEQRLRGQVRGTTAGIGHVMEAVAAAMPALRQSLAEVERNMDDAMRDVPPPPYEDDEDWEE